MTNSALVFGARDNSEIIIPPLQILVIMQVFGGRCSFLQCLLNNNEVEQIYGGGMGDVGQPWISVTSATSATAATGMIFTYQILPPMVQQLFPV